MARDLDLLLERYRRDVPDADLDRRRRRLLLRGAGAPGAARRRRPAGAHLLRLRQGAAGPARRDRPAVRAAPTSRCPTRRSGTSDVTVLRRRAATAVRGSVGSTSTCTRARASTSTPRSSRSPTAWPGGSSPRACWSATSARGLMEHDHVVTLFHEFGHLVHHVLGGHGEWTRFSGVATEWDFVEAPSQMLEEWAWDADVLRTFAVDGGGRADPRRPGRADARGRRLRQGLPGADRRCSTPRCPTGSTPSGPPT